MTARQATGSQRETGSFEWSAATEAKRVAGVFVTNTTDGVLHCSSEARRIFAWDANSHPTPTLQTLCECIHVEDRAAVESAMLKALNEMRPVDMTFRLSLPNRLTRCVRLVCQPIDRATFDGPDYVGVVLDITEVQRAMNALQASHRLILGQLTATKQAMAALSRESDPEQFLGQVLSITIKQLSAHSISIWEMENETGQICLIAVSEGGKLQIPSGHDRPAEYLPWRNKRDHPVWTPFFESGEYCAYGKATSDGANGYVALDQDGPWYDWKAYSVADFRVSTMIKHIASMGVNTVLLVPMLVEGRVTGMLSIRFEKERRFGREEIELTQAMAQQAVLAIQIMRLSKISREAAILSERERYTRDVHDTMAQGFTGVIVQLQAAEDARLRDMLQSMDEHVRHALDLAKNSLAEAQRSVHALRSKALEENSLCDVLATLLETMTSGSELAATITVLGPPRKLPAAYEDNLLHIVQEALTNVVRHAAAKRFDVRIRYGQDAVSLKLRDNGCGFKPASSHGGLGLKGMRERVAALRGKFQVKSRAASGTEIAVSVPYPTTE